MAGSLDPSRGSQGPTSLSEQISIRRPCQSRSPALDDPRTQNYLPAASKMEGTSQQEDELRNDHYIALFRALPRDNWQVIFPDLPGCEASGKSFKEAFHAARRTLARHLSDLEIPPPRPRSSAELLIDAQGDWVLCRQFVDAIMHPVSADDDELAPAELVAMASVSNPTTPQVGT
jgi:predicted RNase H-like HicB family nuclease